MSNELDRNFRHFLNVTWYLADRRTQNCTMLIKSCNLTVGYDLGGVSTWSKRDSEHGKRPVGDKEPHCLYPGDLYPFTRKPLFVIVDSDNSFVFQQIPRYFGQPLMVLMSPQDVPSTLRDLRHSGSLFTLFLHAPLAAFCLICNVGSLPVQHWERCQRYIERFLNEASQLVTRSRCGKDTRHNQLFAVSIRRKWSRSGLDSEG